MFFYGLTYVLTIFIALIYVDTLPWFLGSNRENSPVGRVGRASLISGGRILLTGFYLGILLLYLPTIHFILNMVLFALTVGAYMSYKLAGM